MHADDARAMSDDGGNGRVNRAVAAILARVETAARDGYTSTIFPVSMFLECKQEVIDALSEQGYVVQLVPKATRMFGMEVADLRPDTYSISW